MARAGGLGKGLASLIPSDAQATPVRGLEEIEIAVIIPNPYQPRQHFDEEALVSLTESIREVGVLQPILVRPSGDGYEIIAGERRWRASQRVGLTTIPAVIRETEDTDALEQALIENLHRSDLNPLEEAAAYQQLIEDFALTHEQVAKRVGRSRAGVTNTLRLLQLPPAIQKAVRDGQISMGHARALLGTPDRALQEKLARRIAAEGLSVRAVEEEVRLSVDGPDESGAPKRASSSAGSTKLRPPGLLELEELLSDHLDTRVKVTMTAKRGQVAIDFASLEDLERIYRVISQGKPSG